MNQKKHSVHGLQNIGKLLARGDIAPAPPNREKRDINGIFNQTREKTMAAIPPMVASDHVKHRALFETYLLAGIRDAYNLGHADALAQNSAVDKMLEKQYETRTRVTMPAVVCAVMEQTGLSSMTLDMAQMATVFERCDIDYALDPTTDVIEFTMRPIGAFQDAPLGEPFTEAEEIDPTDPRDYDHLDARRQMEDIEQAERDKPTTSEYEEDKL